MRPLIVIGSAVTVAFLGLVAAVAGGIAAGNQVSVTPGVITRGLLVALAIAATALVWRSRMQPTDRPESLVAGLTLGWFLDLANWSGNGGIGQLFSDSGVAAAMIDLILWVGLSIGVVALLSTSRDRLARRP
jgi:hypothetical protein